MENNNNLSIFDDETIETPFEREEKREDDEQVVISDDVVASIASKAATALDCVHGMSSSVAGDIVELLGVNNPTKGVTVKMSDGNVVIDVYVIVCYGRKFSDIAWDIQETVKTTVENMTGIIVESVNVHVQGVSFEKESENKI